MHVQFGFGHGSTVYGDGVQKKGNNGRSLLKGKSSNAQFLTTATGPVSKARHTQRRDSSSRPGGTTWRHPFIIHFFFCLIYFFFQQSKSLTFLFFSLVAVYRRIFVFIPIYLFPRTCFSQPTFLFYLLVPLVVIYPSGQRTVYITIISHVNICRLRWALDLILGSCLCNMCSVNRLSLALSL